MFDVLSCQLLRVTKGEFWNCFRKTADVSIGEVSFDEWNSWRLHTTCLIILPEQIHFQFIYLFAIYLKLKTSIYVLKAGPEIDEHFQSNCAKLIKHMQNV